MPHRNFDSFIKERKMERTTFTMFGETYTLQPSIPYAAVLQFRALSKRGQNEQLEDMEVLDIFGALLGNDILSSLQTHVEFDIDVAMELMKWALEQYGVTKKDGDDTSPKPARRSK